MQQFMASVRPTILICVCVIVVTITELLGWTINCPFLVKGPVILGS
jgi:hypothetical protein